MKINYLIAALAISTFYCTEVFSQQTNNVEDARIKLFSKELSITEDKSKAVVVIMDQYKASAKQLLEQKELTEAERRVKFDLLIIEKNSKLKKVLTLEQLQKFIPTTEQPKN